MGETSVIYRHPDPQYHADFPNITTTPDDGVLVILRRCGQWAHDATFKFGRPLTFFEANAEIVVLRSTDGGLSLSGETCLFAGLAYDPIIAALSDGRVLAGAVIGEAGSRRDRAQLSGALHRHLPQLDTVIAVRGFGLWWSQNSGRTWVKDPQIASVEGWENVYNLRRPFEVDDGTIIMPVTVGYPWRTRCVGLLRSWDGGETWGDHSFVAEDPAGRAHRCSAPALSDPQR